MGISYSVSKINTFENCPRQYKFQYIDRAVVEKPVGVETFLGDAVHRTLEQLYKLKINGRVQPVDEMLSFYMHYWEGPDRDRIKVTRDNLGIDDYIKVGADGLRRFHETYAPFDNGITLALEKNIGFPLDLDGRFPMLGKIDRIARRADGVIEIIDYKTNASLPSQTSLDNDNQMGLYQIGVRHLWPDFAQIELKQIFLRHGLELKTVMDDDRLEEIRYRAFQKILEIEEAGRQDRFPPHESALCDWCVYYHLCPAKRHRLALDDAAVELQLDPETGRSLAEKYLTLNHQKHLLEAELKALKDEIVDYCEKLDLTRLDTETGNLKLTVSETDSFPTKTDDEKGFMQISLLAREAGLEECFKLDPRVLYEEFFKKERLPAGLKEKLASFIRRKRREEIRTSYKIESKENPA